MATEFRSTQSVALNPNISAEQLETGNDFYLRGCAFLQGRDGFPRKVHRAFELFQTGARLHGHEMCIYNAAVLLVRGGEGVPKDQRKAQYFFELLVEENATSAMINLAFLLTNGGEGTSRDPLRAKQLLIRAIELGDIAASLNLGLLLERGAAGVERDPAAAKVLFETASEHGNLSALFALGQLVLHGDDGVNADPAMAKECFQKAAQQGHAAAMNAFGALLLHNPPGIERDPVTAKKYFEKAAQLEHPMAFYNLGVLLENGDEGVQADRATAMKWFQQGTVLNNQACINRYAAVLSEDEDKTTEEKQLSVLQLINESVKILVGNTEDAFRTAMGEGGSIRENSTSDFVLTENRPGGIEAETFFILGSMSRRGEGVEKNALLAKQMYELAVQKGHIRAMVNLGNLLLYGDDGVDVDPPAAKLLFERAAAAENPIALLSLGELLLRGDTGVRRNVSVGISHLERSVRLGGPPFAKTTLARVLLSESLEERDPVRAAALLESSAQESCPLALHELAVLLERGDDGVPVNRERSNELFARTASGQYSSNVNISRETLELLAAGEDYAPKIDEYLQYSTSNPRTCLLLTLGGTDRGKTSTIRSLRGMPFIDEHIPTHTASMSKCIVEPGRRGLEEEIISEFDFNENSLPANASRTGFLSAEFRASVSIHKAHAERFASRSPPTPNLCSERLAQMKYHNGDVIERVRRAIVQNSYPQGFRSSIIRCWDMAGQSEYEIVNSLFVARGDILMFVTNLQNIQKKETRHREAAMLCYWMQLAHAVVLDPSLVRVVIAGTHKGRCGDEILALLHKILLQQLGSAVYDSWIKTPEGEDADGSLSYGNIVAIENSIAEEAPNESGIVQLERAVKNAADAVVKKRGEIPLRWLALIDQLERDERLCLSKEYLEEICKFFPGFHYDASKRSKEMLEAFRCLASMGRLVLFELSSSEYYVITDTEAIVKLTGKVVAPEHVLQRRLSHADMTELGKGRISRTCLFSLWEECHEEEKDILLKLLFEYDVLMLLESGEECIIGIPSLLPHGWENFRWIRAEGERDLAVTTQFRDVVPNGFIGRVMAHLHRKISFNNSAPGLLSTFAGLFTPVSRSAETFITPVIKMVRANAVLLSVWDGSRVFVGFSVAERQLHWKFRGKQPLELAWACIRQVERMLETRMNIVRKHIVSLDCQCGEYDGLEMELPQSWLFASSFTNFPTKAVICKACQCPRVSGDIIDLHLEKAPALAPSLLPEPVTPPLKYKVFLSHAGPDKLKLARPIYEALESHGITTFLDYNCLLVDSSTAIEAMHRAMDQAEIGIFILTPPFAARKWTLIELRRFLERNRTSESNHRPALLPVFYGLSIGDCHNVYNDGGLYEKVLHETGFFSLERQALCSTAQAAEAMREITTFSGVENVPPGGGRPFSSAEIAMEIVGRVLRFLEVGKL